ncbi:MAG: flagellar basal body rod protein FlgB [Eubacteriales bacterium]
MNTLISNNMHMLESSMDYLWQKQAVIADNVANAETPNYKAKYVQFESGFQATLINAVNDNLKSWEVAENIQRATPYVYEASTELYTSDQNGVDVGEQEIEAMRNNFQLQYVLNSINSEFSILRGVISG